ncbi:hypothetical protein KP509_39G027900 [Ceratopteris richardii]|nr:hypothetical protein KP509_39G027900 [Ceratopteris richardii]
MAALGDKIGSSLIAQAAGVPTLPWSGSHVKVPFEVCKDAIPDDLYKAACVYTTEEAVTSCQAVGYPVMIKASWGGGGKGIRKVHNDEEVRALFKQVQGEVPGSPIFTMKVASQSRHLEVQLLCDQYGNVAALHSRDCSIQRRHQKIIEEGPITIASPETVHLLEQGARRLAKCVNYVGAATVEYLYSMETGEFYFLELNPRLQVEHPVTEWIAEINLPAAQLCVAMGIPLWKIPEIRRFYGKDEGGSYDSWASTGEKATEFDFDQAVSVKPKGHCVAVRVTSEDPDDGFKPTSGKVQELNFRGKPNVWAYFSVKSGGGIHEFSDSQFGHVFAFGENRGLAIANMVLGLKELQIRGEIRTNVDYTVDLIHAQEYRENKFHTGWLDSRIAMRIRAERPPWFLSVIGGALCKASMLTSGRVSEYVGYLEKGQIPPKHISLVSFQIALNIEGSKYTVDLVRGAPGSYRLRLNNSQVEADFYTLRDGGLLIQLDGNSHVIYAEEEAAGTRLLINGQTCLLQNDHDPSRLIAETPCKLLRFLVPDGSHIDPDMPYAEVEVMKMCMPLLCPAAGTIHFKMSEGQAMMAGDLIASLDLDDPSAVRKAVPYEGGFPPLGPPTPIAGKVHQRCAASIQAAQNVLAGYDHDIDEVVETLLSCLDDPQLPLLQWQECMSVLATRLPKDLKAQLDMKFKEYESSFSVTLGSVEFPAKSFRTILEAYISSVSEKDKSTIERLLEPLLSLAKSYEGGREGHACNIVQSLFKSYLDVEELFNETPEADVIEGLRQRYKKDLLRVVDIVLSHQGVRMKNKLILRLMGALVYANPAAYREQLIRFAVLNDPKFAELAVRAIQLLEQTKLSELRSTIARSLSELEMFTEEGSDGVYTPRRRSAIEQRIEAVVNSPEAVEDALLALFDHSDHTLQRRVVETYIRRLYQPHLIKGTIKMQWHRTGLLASWQYWEDSPVKALDVTSIVGSQSLEDKQWGAMVIITNLNVLSSAVSSVLKEASESTLSGPGNALHVALVGINNSMGNLQDSGDEDQAQERIEKLVKALKDESLLTAINAAGVKVVSCIIQRDEGRSPMRHCFYWSNAEQNFVEESTLRHVEPPLSNILELSKLKGYSNVHYAPSRDRLWHIYTGVDKPAIRRMFLRALLRQPAPSNMLGTETDSFTSESVIAALQGALEELELSAYDVKTRADHIHMFLSILRAQEIRDLCDHSTIKELRNQQLGEDTVVHILEDLALRVHGRLGLRMHRLAVASWEIRVKVDLLGQITGSWRLMVTNPTSHTCIIKIYSESIDPVSKTLVYSSPEGHPQGPMHGLPLDSPHKPLDAVERKRLIARRNNTIYCYDFPLLFKRALLQAWGSSDKDVLKSTELVFADKPGWGGILVESDRPIATNDVGMIGWIFELNTPEFPMGRKILVVANDATHGAGAFGPKEDYFFKAMADLACEKKLPLIYLAANSGARIGVAEEVRSCFKIEWADKLSPDRGFQYLYLTEEDYERSKYSVNAHELRLESGEVRWVIDDIIGIEDGLGAENLSGSGAIAGAYSRAYKETFTLTYVSGRTVGIGAYLARLGMRCIQRSDQPIILTGYSALNKLLGREVYSSQMQLGGPKIMGVNGVTHLIVNDDLEGVSAILKWLSYVPPYVGGPLPCIESADPPERLVEYDPENSCDPRAAIRGVQTNGKWISGIFDKDSFVETLDGWAKTVITGRARLGGIPVAIIAVETQTVMQMIPADPGQLDSHERVVPQAGQVWFPDSASKTAQALMDFNKEGLPVFIMANWRGFSGGQRDLFEGILQAGSNIVENLRTYEHPVFVYLPKTGELRGGAWVVIDSKINPEEVEMFADTTAKAGVLEPEGLIEIKFRTKEILECMHRLDPEILKLKRDLQEKVTEDASMSIQRKIQAREKILLPVYKQVAIRFAELHDTAARLEAKGVIKKVVDWSNARSYFYKRLKRRVAEESLIKEAMAAAGGNITKHSAAELVKQWFLSSRSCSAEEQASLWQDDAPFFDWMSDKKAIDEHFKQLRAQYVVNHVLSLSRSSTDLKVLPEALKALLQKVDSAEREVLLQQLQDVISGCT